MGNIGWIWKELDNLFTLNVRTPYTSKISTRKFHYLWICLKLLDDRQTALRRLTWVFTIRQSPFYGTPGINRLKGLKVEGRAARVEGNLVPCVFIMKRLRVRLGIFSHDIFSQILCRLEEHSSYCSVKLSDKHFIAFIYLNVSIKYIPCLKMLSAFLLNKHRMHKNVMGCNGLMGPVTQQEMWSWVHICYISVVMSAYVVYKWDHECMWYTSVIMSAYVVYKWDHECLCGV